MNKSLVKNGILIVSIDLWTARKFMHYLNVHKRTLFKLALKNLLILISWNCLTKRRKDLRHNKPIGKRWNCYKVFVLNWSLTNKFNSWMHPEACGLLSVFISINRRWKLFSGQFVLRNITYEEVKRYLQRNTKNCLHFHSNRFPSKSMTHTHTKQTRLFTFPHVTIVRKGVIIQ